MSRDVPPPDAGRSVPPPPGSEAHENDVLARRKKFSWKNFGGDGFLVSVAFHVLLAIIAIFYIVSRYTAPQKKTDPDVFATGAGGGANGEKPKAFEQKMRTRQVNVKTPVRITSKSAGAISLPDTPQTNTASFASGLTSGGMSKGSGGGTGGGEGTGIGIGKGGGKNFVSLFGARGANLPGLPGTFYDIKQTADGRPSRYDIKSDAAAEAAQNEAYGNEVLRRFCGGARAETGGRSSLVSGSWDPAFLDKSFFKAPEQLVASQIFIPHQSADAAPAAYGVADKVKGRRWIAHYKGIVTAPKSGKFRFWGLADDVMVVRWNAKNVLDSGWTVLSVPGSFFNGNSGAAAGKSIFGSKVLKKAAQSVPFHAGPWIEVTKGRDYPMELVISEVPGGGFGGWLMMEEMDSSTNDGDGKIFLARFSDEPLPGGIVDDTGLAVDMGGKGLVWRARSAGKAAVR